MANENKAIALLRDQLGTAHSLLEGTVEGVTPEQAHWPPGGNTVPIGANYAHVLTSEDALVNAVLKGGAPLAAASWAGKAGLSEPAPIGPWGDWARRVQVDLPALRGYAQAVYAATDEYAATLGDDDLARTVDLSALGFGEKTIGWVLSIAILNANTHCGEIACIKGLQGLTGYPV